MTRKAKFDPYETITAKLIELMESEGTNWVKPWATIGSHYNVKSGKPYRGVNVMLTGASAAGRFNSRAWGTYKQWQERGGQVRKGEKGTEIVFWKRLETERENADGEKEKRVIPMLRLYYVFNADQVDGIETPDDLETPDVEPIDERVARIVERSNVDLVHVGDRACYSPIHDQVKMPPKEFFNDTKDGTAHEHYHGTLLHELTHWTGHKSRLARDLFNRFGSQKYAFEELIAETGSALLCCALGIEPEPRADHAKYLNGWLEVLKSDKKALFTAFGQAQKAADFILAFDQDADDETAKPREIAA